MASKREREENSRDRRGVLVLETLIRDLIFGVRAQLKTPAVTLAIVVTLAFGIAATTVAFSLPTTPTSGT